MRSGFNFCGSIITMAFDLKLNINAFPACGKCGKDMALVRVVELEITVKDKRPSFSSTEAIESDKEEEAKDTANFVWKCGGCGYILTHER